MPITMRVDVHQHIWTGPLVERLAAREALPLIRRTDGLCVLHSAAEQPYVIDLEAEAPVRRAELVATDGLDLALVAISSPIGIEALPREEALALIEAHLDGVAALPAQFAAWGPIALDGAQPGDVDALAARGCVGLSLPAGAIAGPDRLDALGPVLQRAAALELPVFVHPGRARGERPGAANFGEPLWWRALTDYVGQMQAAWLTFACDGRREHPALTIVFAMLAGCAPLHAERLLSRGGPAPALGDPRTYYEISSYGPVAIETIASLVGKGQLLYGSDRPVIEPPPSGAYAEFKSAGAEVLGLLARRPARTVPA
jgi:predicted TIM-barrel fold metal-dependent hydrolase